VQDYKLTFCATLV